MKPAVLAFAALVLLVQQTATPKPFDPVGRWSFSTSSDTGAVTGTLQITGTPGAYQGQATLPDGTALPISDVMTSPNGMMAVCALADGSLALFKLVRDTGSAGKYVGAWGQIAQSYSITAEKIGG